MPLPDAWGSTGYILGSDQNIKYCDGSVSQTYTLSLASPRLAAATSSTGMECFYPDGPPKVKTHLLALTLQPSCAEERGNNQPLHT